MNSSAASPVTLADLAAALPDLHPRVIGNPSTTLCELTQDSRQVTPGSMFAVRLGAATRGQVYIADAAARGASALLCEPLSDEAALSLPRLEVAALRAALGRAAEVVHGHPSRKLRLIGITGTNGKTTTASLLSQCLQGYGANCSQLGTLGFELGGKLEPFGLTTPEADAISRYLAASVAAGCAFTAMEVSSHALTQERVQALHFAVAAFSNLTQDHLDFHGTLEEYGEAKAKLFLECAPEHAVLNIDDAFGADLLRRVPSALSVGRSPKALVRLLEETDAGSMQRLRVLASGQEVVFETQLFGAHNVENWLLCIGILQTLGQDLSRLAEIGPSVRAARGRFERCDGPQDDVKVVVDYAHTPDALQRALSAARPLSSGRLLCVFGCGGDRDPGKRAKMGAEAAHGADYTVITNDNPRSEEPAQIAASIEGGLLAAGGRAYEICLDRRTAIERAILAAASGDLVLIAGKGHEDYQLIQGQRLSFDDRAEAKRALGLRQRRAAGQA
jgi:UDP-N-acetylmuramoyl-L-alanyl-D-glutamate--2,6-diaminopimelate ligase